MSQKYYSISKVSLIRLNVRLYFHFYNGWRLRAVVWIVKSRLRFVIQDSLRINLQRGQYYKVLLMLVPKRRAEGIEPEATG